MTEAEWVAATDPQPMLEFLAGKASDRKLRLFACACCRQIWHLLTDKRSRKAVQVAERLAEGIAKTRERVAAEAAAWRAAEDARLAGRGHADAATEAAEGAWTALRESSDEEDLATIAFNVACHTAAAACYSVRGADRVANDPADYAALAAAEEDQAAILRDLIDNPFRVSTLEPTLLSGKARTAVKVAQAIYTDQAFDHLPILADALEEAGCSDEAILGHCRRPGEHVRGCWVLDLLLGKV